MSIAPTTIVSIFKPKGNSILILIQKANSNENYVFTIETMTGSICFDGIPGSSIFNSRREAINAINNSYDGEYDSIATGVGLIGLIKIGSIL